MTQAPRPVRSDETAHIRPESTPEGGSAVVESAVLMHGQRELIIRHGSETYRLRVTASNKLILTK